MLFKMPRLGMPRFQTRHCVTVASGLRHILKVQMRKSQKGKYLNFSTTLFLEITQKSLMDGYLQCAVLFKGKKIDLDVMTYTSI